MSELTAARVGLGVVGASVPTAEELRFRLDHALARDAVHAAMDVPLVVRGLAALGVEPVVVRSAAGSREEYLRRPDLGRRLRDEDVSALMEICGGPTQVPEAGPGAPDSVGSSEVVVVLADGLSALAVERHGVSVVEALLPLIDVGAVIMATQARVALGDEIGEVLGAKVVVMLIGERPGLSSPDSLGAYITWEPRRGRTDAERNCLSNIRAEGLSYADAAARIAYFVREARRLRTTGIALKDPEPAEGITSPSSPALP